MGHPYHVATCNISGLRLDKKREAVFHWLKGCGYDFVFLQETHCHLRKEEVKWSHEWGTQSIWSRGTNRSKGVAVLFNPKCKYVIKNKVIDPNGRYIIFDIISNENSFRFINIYAPNSEVDRVMFINKMHSWMNPDIETFIAGDFNCALNSDIDRLNCVGSRDIGQIDMSLFMKHYDMEDIFRRRNPTKRVYSWCRGDKKSRIDYWLVSKSMDNQIDCIDYHPCPFSDHDIVNLTFRDSETEHGPGSWKMNEKVIKSDLFRDSFIGMWEEWKKEKCKYDNLNKWWDLGKSKIKNLAKWVSQKLSQDRKDRAHELEKQLKYLKERSYNHNHDDRIELLTAELNILLYEKAEGAKIRSRAQWFEEGEKGTKFFHNLERHNSKDKLWHKIENKEGHIIKETQSIQKIQVEFYSDLYQSRNIDLHKKDKFLNVLSRKFSQESKDILNKDVTLDELYNSVKKMKPNKTPGPDGIIIEFYKLYWEYIKQDLLDSYSYSFEMNEMSYTQYLALIILLYKKGKRENIKNWRPISLSNNDTKILSKVFAGRLRIVLPEIIHTDQNGCLSGRFIGQGIRLVQDILDKCDDEEVILLVDQEKAFDRVEWAWLNYVMEAFDCGDKFIRWINIMYKYMKSAIVTNGYISNYFPVTRGIRQGDSLSALLYILQSEPLNEYIRQDKDIRGVIIKDFNKNEIEVKGSQYVDDQEIFLNSYQQIGHCMNVLDDFGYASGSKVNKTKTVGLLPNKKNIDTGVSVALTTKPEKVLGVPISKDKIQNQYWESISEKLVKKIAPWKIRNLSIVGKIYIIKSLAMSQVLYGCEMTLIDQCQITKIMDIIWDFLWDGKQCKMDKEVCKLPRYMGGLGMPDLYTIVKVRRVKMLIKILQSNDDAPWSVLPKKYFRCLDSKYDLPYFALLTDDATKEINNCNIPLFYKEALLFYQELCRKGRQYENNEDEILWCNSKLVHNNCVFTYHHWSKSGIQRISDLIDNSSFKESEIHEKLIHKAGFTFEIYSIKKSTPGYWISNTECLKVTFSSLESILNVRFEIPSVGIKKLADLTSSDLYKIFLYTKHAECKSENYWISKFPDKGIDFDNWYMYNFINKCTPNKCLDFNWKIFHGQVNTEKKLQLMNYSDGKCSLCKVKLENLEHLLFDCIEVNGIWSVIENMLNTIVDKHLALDKFTILVGIISNDKNDTDEILNMVLSISRWIIWKRRCLLRYDKKYLSIIQLINWVRQEIYMHIDILLQKCKTNKARLLTLKDNIFSSK